MIGCSPPLHGIVAVAGDRLELLPVFVAILFWAVLYDGKMVEGGWQLRRGPLLTYSCKDGEEGVGAVVESKDYRSLFWAVVRHWWVGGGGDVRHPPPPSILGMACAMSYFMRYGKDKRHTSI